jgi:cyclopropane fatty-acyl-phospholipid synthase-like methyltransferase
MAANITWTHKDELSLLRAHGGWEFGNTFDEAFPKLQAKKANEAGFTASLLQLNKDDIYCEIGPGFGFEANILAPLVKELHLLEISKSFQDVCRTVVKHQNVQFHLIEPSKLDVLNQIKPTKVYSTGVLIHFNVYDLFIYLEAIAESMSQGGRFVFTFLNLDAPDALQSAEWNDVVSIYRKDKTRLVELMYWNSQSTIVKLCHAVGFSIEQTYFPDNIYSYVSLVKR